MREGIGLFAYHIISSHNSQITNENRNKRSLQSITMPSTPPTTNLIINRSRPPTWIFLPPPEDPDSDLELNSDFLPPYPPPPTRPPPLTPPRRIYLSPRTSPAKWSPDGENDTMIHSSTTMTPDSSYASASSSLSRRMHDFGDDEDLKEKERTSTVGSSSTSTSSDSNSNSNSKPSTPHPDPASFHPISHAPLSKSTNPHSGTQPQAPPRIRPPIPKPRISEILAAEFHSSSHAHTHPNPDLNLNSNLETQQQAKEDEEEDPDDWVIIPQDKYSISSSSASAHPIPPTTKEPAQPNENPDKDPEKSLTTLGYLFNFLYATYRLPTPPFPIPNSY